ncbi:MAG: hypothetical protein ABW019_12245 [Chitinophagaceae bacterium]
MRIIILALLLPVVAIAQKEKNAAVGWRVNAASGVITGESAAKPLYQFSGGITYARFFSGIGIGYDKYRFNTIPVFADWRMDVDHSRQTYLYVQPGYGFTAGNNPEEPEYGRVADRLKGGFSLDAGIGYRLAVGKRNGFLLSAGYGLKYMVHEKTYLYCATCDTDPVTDTYRYRFGRILLKAGWEFGSRGR